MKRFPGYAREDLPPRIQEPWDSKRDRRRHYLQGATLAAIWGLILLSVLMWVLRY